MATRKHTAADVWPVGVLYSQTGVTSVIEKTQLQATLLAIDEINAAGGVAGEQIKPIVYDPQSDPETFAMLAERLIRQDNVKIIFGCYMSSTRRAVIPVAEQTDTLLCYPTYYEGFEFSRNVLYLGSVPNQTNIVLADFLLRNYGTKIFLLGSDYIFPRESNRLFRNIIDDIGGEVVGERYIPLNSSPLEFDLFMSQLKRFEPDVILSTVVGGDVGKLFTAYARSEFDPRVVPIASISATEAEVGMLDPQITAGHISCGTYFGTVETPENKKFLGNYAARFGKAAIPNMCAEAAYSIVHVVSEAMKKVQVVNPQSLVQALHSFEFRAPQGLIKIDGENNHAYLWCRIAKIDDNQRFNIVYESPSPIKPDPYMVEAKTSLKVPTVV